MSERFYCKWCGISYFSIGSMSRGFCSKNPNGKKHELYEGSEKSKFYCKWCGMSYFSISSMSCGFCSKNPSSRNHEPAL
ncbi:MAG: hypothetical protein J1G30_06320 [Spirochaetales bacterium]|nr:hypothetical protein [Spirochaetales bacterium]